MGSPVSHIMANVNMENSEEKALRTVGESPLVMEKVCG